MKARLFLTLCASVCLCAAIWAQSTAGQQTQPVESSDPSRIVLDVTRVNVLYTVTDKKGRFITDLAKEDFQIFEGKKQQTIQQFTAESDLPCASPFWSIPAIASGSR